MRRLNIAFSFLFFDFREIFILRIDTLLCVDSIKIGIISNLNNLNNGRFNK